MAPFSMRCPKCGLIQARASTCKACGATVRDTSASPPTSPAAKKQETPFSRAEPAFLRETPSVTPPATTGTEQARRPSFHGTGGTLFGIQMVNTLLTLLTLGIYSFWGKVRIRKYLMSATEFEGDRFAYHGTGKELLVGTLKAGLIFGLPIAILNALPKLLGGGVALQVATGILTYSLIMVFIPFAMVGARRYRLSRTSWRGIRFSFRGRSLEFVKLFMKGSFLTTISLGLYYPFFDTNRYAFMASNSYFGNQKLRFNGAGRDLFLSYLIALPLSVVTLGIYWFWYLAKKQRYLTERTSFATAHFCSTVTGGRFFLLAAGNFLLLSVPLVLALAGAGGLLFLLGAGQGWQNILAMLAAGGKELLWIVLTAIVGWFAGWFFVWTWIILRNVRFSLAYVALEGPLDITAIQQEAQAASPTGEGLAGFLDLDFDLG